MPDDNVGRGGLELGRQKAEVARGKLRSERSRADKIHEADAQCLRRHSATPRDAHSRLSTARCRDVGGELVERRCPAAGTRRTFGMPTWVSTQHAGQSPWTA